MKCPHCTISIHESWNTNQIFSRGADGQAATTNWRVQCMSCPDCKKSILRYGLCQTGPNWIKDPGSWSQFHPSDSSRTLPKEVPPDIAKDYSEAAKVLHKALKPLPHYPGDAFNPFFGMPGTSRKISRSRSTRYLAKLREAKLSLQVCI
jgi:hypothetical protein